MAPVRSGTLFNLPSMRQVIQKAFGKWDNDKLIIKHKDRIIDPFRAAPALYTDDQGYIKDFNSHKTALTKALNNIEYLILTLGLTESWKFAHDQSFTSLSPWLIHPLLIRSENLSVERCSEELELIYKTIKEHNPNLKLIISISPVPLNKSFEHDEQIIVSNCYSKSVL